MRHEGVVPSNARFVLLGCGGFVRGAVEELGEGAVGELGEAGEGPGCTLGCAACRSS
jgi:hypothetical protein